jgi:hypothetical protein
MVLQAAVLDHVEGPEARRIRRLELATAVLPTLATVGSSAFSGRCRRRRQSRRHSLVIRPASSPPGHVILLPRLPLSALFRLHRFLVQIQFPCQFALLKAAAVLQKPFLGF